MLRTEHRCAFAIRPRCLAQPNTMPKPLVFISHSARKDPDVWPIVLAIRDRLAGDFDVLLDADELKPMPGINWRPTIEQWMWRCHAAVVVLSEPALTSAQVQKEVVFLTGRRGIDPHLIVIPVMVAPVTRTKLKEGIFGAVAITELQMLAGEDAQTPGLIADRLEPTKHLNDGAIDRYERQLADVLRRTGLHEVDPFLLDKGFVALDLDVADWQPRVEDRYLILAQRLLSVDYQTAIEAIKELAQPLTGSAALLVTEYVAPLWVDATAAARLPAIARGPNELRILGLTGSRWETAELYVRRACLSYPWWEAIEINPPNAVSGGAGEEWILAELQAWYQRRECLQDLDLDDDELLEAMQTLAEDDPIFIVVPGPIELAELAGARAALPFTTFIVLLGHESPEAGERHADRYEVLEPLLTPDEESQARKTYVATKLFLSRL
jgi:hypothetical protein